MRCDHDEFVSDLNELSVRHDWNFWLAFGRCFRGVLTVQRGDLSAGLHLLEEALRGPRSINFGVHYLYFLCEYASALGLAGRTDRGLDAGEQAIARSDRNDERWCIAEVLRIKGELLHRQGKFEDADAAFATARVWAERQGALSLSLRIATAAARLWQDMGRAAAAEEAGTHFGYEHRPSPVGYGLPRAIPAECSDCAYSGQALVKKGEPRKGLLGCAPGSTFIARSALLSYTGAFSNDTLPL